MLDYTIRANQNMFSRKMGLRSSYFAIQFMIVIFFTFLPRDHIIIIGREIASAPILMLIIVRALLSPFPTINIHFSLTFSKDATLKH